MRDEDKTDRTPRDKLVDKRNGIDYSRGSSKRFKTDEEDYDCIFAIP